MSDSKLIASELAQSFKIGIEKNNNNEITNLFEDWIFYYRYYGVKWNKLFLIELEKILSEEIFFNILDNFDLKLNLSNNDIKDIEEIIKTKSQKKIFFNFDTTIDCISYLRLYKRYIIRKHIHASVYYYLKIFKSNNKNIKNLFKSISKNSISGDLFIYDEQKDLYSFSIPKNRSSVFIFMNKENIYSIDVSISPNYDSKIIVPHFSIIQSSYNKDINKFKENIVTKNKLEYIDIIKPLNEHGDENIKNIPKEKCNYILCHESDIEYSFIDSNALKNIKLISTMKTFHNDYRINFEIYKIILSNFRYSMNKDDFNYIDIQYSLSFLINKFLKNEINEFKLLLTNKDFKYIQAALENIFNYIHVNLSESGSYNELHKACSFLGIERESDIDLIFKNLTLKDLNKKISNHDVSYFKKVRVKLLKHIIEEITFDSKSNNKNKKETHKELERYLDISEKEVKKILKSI